MRLGASGGRPTWALMNQLRTRATHGGTDTSEQIAEALMNADRAAISQTLDRVNNRKAFDALKAHERELLLRALSSGAAGALPMQAN